MLLITIKFSSNAMLITVEHHFLTRTLGLGAHLRALMIISLQVNSVVFFIVIGQLIYMNIFNRTKYK